jgi:hypothetical protein
MCIVVRRQGAVANAVLTDADRRSLGPAVLDIRRSVRRGRARHERSHRARPIGARRPVGPQGRGVVTLANIDRALW